MIGGPYFLTTSFSAGYLVSWGSWHSWWRLPQTLTLSVSKFPFMPTSGIQEETTQQRPHQYFKHNNYALVCCFESEKQNSSRDRKGSFPQFILLTALEQKETQLYQMGLESQRLCRALQVIAKLGINHLWCGIQY